MHISARAVSGTAIFELPMARRRYLSLLTRACKRYSVTMIFFVIMGNHVHLLAWGPGSGISRLIQLVHSQFARWVNQQTAGQGHVFQARFDGRVVAQTGYLIALLRYLARNPVAAGLTTSPAAYPWSADRYYRSGRGSALVDLAVARTLTTLAADPRAYAKLVDRPGLSHSGTARLRQDLIQRALLTGVTPDALRGGRDPVVSAARTSLIRTWLAAGEKADDVAKLLGVSRMTIYRQTRSRTRTPT